MQKKSRPTISLVIVTHNLQEVLLLKKPDLLAVFDEIVVVNTGKVSKNDITHRNYRVFYKNFEGYFPIIKNFALEKANSEWIFTLDTDEDVQIELIQAIPTLVKDTSIEGYWLRRRYYLTMNTYLKHGVFYPDFQLRLFRNRPEYRYSGGVHALLPIPENRTLKLELDIFHFSTKPKYNSFKDFKNMWLYIQMDALEYSHRKYSILFLVSKGITAFTDIFFGGFFRGKGFLDGWAGFRAHLIFGFSILFSYWLASYYNIRKTNQLFSIQRTP